MKFFCYIIFSVPLVFMDALLSLEKNQYHKIKRGDNLTTISERYGVSIRDISALNGIQSNHKIFVGRRLKIPRPAKKQWKRKYIIPPFINPLRKKRKKLIRGFDLKGGYRTPGLLWRLDSNSRIHSSASGRIIKIGYLREYGRYIMIDHGGGWLSFYSSLSRVFVRKGQKVFVGEEIASSTNKKLFFSISYKGKPLNPASLLRRKKGLLSTS